MPLTELRQKLDRREWLLHVADLEEIGRRAHGLPSLQQKTRPQEAPQQKTGVSRRVLREAGAMSVREPEERSFEPGYPSLAAGVEVADTHDVMSDNILTVPPFATKQTNEVLDAALDFSPDPNHAKWVYGQLGLAEWDLECYRLTADGETDDPDPEARDEAMRFARRILQPYGGGIDALLRLGLDSVLRRGAMAAELDVADSLDDVLDVDLIEPRLIDWQVKRDGDHRWLVPVYRPAGGGSPVDLNKSQFYYQGINTAVGIPHGQSPFLPLISTHPRSRGLRTSVERVASNHAFSRIHWILDWDKVACSAPPDTVDVSYGDNGEPRFRVLDWRKFKAHMDGVMDDMKTRVRDMYEDDSWVTFDSVGSESLGAAHASESMSVSELAEFFDTDEIVATHGQPAIHGRQWGSDLSSTGQVQWIITALGIEYVRSLPARAAEWVLNQYFAIRGVPAYAKITFPEIRKEDRREEAEADRTETETALLQYQAGIIDLDELAMRLVGHPPPEPGPESEEDTDEEPEDEQPEDEQLRLEFPRGNGHRHDHPIGPEWTDEQLQADPFVPDDPDVAGELELIVQLDDEAVAESQEDFDKWAAESAPAWVDFLDAVEVGDVPREETLAPSPRSEWTSDKWQWDSRLARFRYKPSANRRLGNLVPEARVRRMMERRVAAVKTELGGITDDLLKNKISPRQWQNRCLNRLSNAHLQARQMAIGGGRQMTELHFHETSELLRQDKSWLTQFGNEIADGRLTEARIQQRIGYYGEANIRNGYARGRTLVAMAAGYQEERWQLGIADHCEGCLYQASRGWVQIGTLPDLGTQDCLNNCKCHKEQRVSAEEKYPTLAREYA